MNLLFAVMVIAGAAAANVAVKDVIDAMVIPPSDALFNVGRQTPESYDEWSALRNQAVILVEAGRALTIEDRSRGATWDRLSEEMSAAGQGAIDAIDARNVDGLLDAGNALMDACTSCHIEYLSNAN